MYALTARPPCSASQSAAVSRRRRLSHVFPYLQVSGRPRSALQRAQDAATASEMRALPLALVGPVDFDPCIGSAPMVAQAAGGNLAPSFSPMPRSKTPAAVLRRAGAIQVAGGDWIRG